MPRQKSLDVEAAPARKNRKTGLRPKPKRSGGAESPFALLGLFVPPDRFGLGLRLNRVAQQSFFGQRTEIASPRTELVERRPAPQAVRWSTDGQSQAAAGFGVLSQVQVRTSGSPGCASVANGG